jgi:hypothetical protein
MDGTLAVGALLGTVESLMGATEGNEEKKAWVSQGYL